MASKQYIKKQAVEIKPLPIGFSTVILPTNTKERSSLKVISEIQNHIHIEKIVCSCHLWQYGRYQ